MMPRASADILKQWSEWATDIPVHWTGGPGCPLQWGPEEHDASAFVTADVVSAYGEQVAEYKGVAIKWSDGKLDLFDVFREWFRIYQMGGEDVGSYHWFGKPDGPVFL